MEKETTRPILTRFRRLVDNNETFLLFFFFFLLLSFSAKSPAGVESRQPFSTYSERFFFLFVVKLNAARAHGDYYGNRKRVAPQTRGSTAILFTLFLFFLPSLERSINGHQSDRKRETYRLFSRQLGINGNHNNRV